MGNIKICIACKRCNEIHQLFIIWKPIVLATFNCQKKSTDILLFPSFKQITKLFTYNDYSVLVLLNRRNSKVQQNSIIAEWHYFSPWTNRFKLNFWLRCFQVNFFSSTDHLRTKGYLILKAFHLTTDHFDRKKPVWLSESEVDSRLHLYFLF